MAETESQWLSDVRCCRPAWWLEAAHTLVLLLPPTLRTTPAFLFFFLFTYLFIFCLFAISWVAPAAYGGSQARGAIRAVAAGLHHSHSSVGSKLRL